MRFGYKMSQPPLTDSQLEMCEDYQRLLMRIEKLEMEIDWAEKSDKVSDEHYRMMRIQYFAMCAYEGALRMRIEDLGIDLKKD